MSKTAHLSGFEGRFERAQSFLVIGHAGRAFNKLCDDLSEVHRLAGPHTRHRTVKIDALACRRLNSEQPRARVDRSDIETSIGFERRFRAVLYKFLVAIQEYWAQQEIKGSSPARCETVPCPKIRTNSSLDD